MADWMKESREDREALRVREKGSRVRHRETQKRNPGVYKESSVV